MHGDPFRDAQRCARRLLRRFGVLDATHINIEAFAARLGCELVEAPLQGASAQLIRAGKRTTIMLSDRVTDPAARRFSIAHELGHLVLDHPSGSIHELCTKHARQRAAIVRDYEAEANAFASELLMPARLVRPSCAIAPVDLTVPRRIADAYNVSILASTRRFTELASERCAAVFSSHGKVRWVASSATFTRSIARERLIDRGSLAWGFYERGEIPDEPRRVPASAWLDDARKTEIVEHSIYSRELQTVLTMLWVPQEQGARLGMP